MTAHRYAGPGGMFDSRDLICPAHADFRLECAPAAWTPTVDDGTCFICAEDRHIANAERMT